MTTKTPTKEKAPRTQPIRITLVTLERMRKEAKRNGRTISGHIEFVLNSLTDAAAKK